MENHKFIFLCGLHRSGTTPLFRILREHPQISGFRETGVPEDEGQHLQTVFASALAYGGPGRFGFAAEAHLTEDSPLLTASNKERLFAEWSRHWDMSREFLLEKSPPNLIRTRFLQAAFPESYFIAILRHPIAVSLATLKWARTRLDSLVRHWLDCHAAFELDRRYLRRVTVIRYEDLIRDTSSSLEKIFGFLSIPPIRAAQLDPRGNDRYFVAWREFAKRDPGRLIVSDLVDRYEKKVAVYGYSLKDVPVLSPEYDSRTQGNLAAGSRVDCA